MTTACGVESDSDDSLSFRYGYESSGGPSGTWGSSTSTDSSSSSWGSWTGSSDGDSWTTGGYDVPGASTGGDSTSTSYGSTSYGSTSYGSTSYGSTSYGSTSSTGSSGGSSEGSSSGGPDDCLAEAGLTEEDLSCSAGSGSGSGSGGSTGGETCACDDPCEIRPPESEVPCNYDYTETCTIIDGITVCDREYVKGEYQCLDFTNDFCQACTDAGVPSWTLTLGCVYRNYHWCLGYDPVFSHATAIVEVDYPGPNRKFCVVEPQNNDEVYCWIDDEAPSDTLPGHVMTGLHAYYDAWGYQDCIDDGWTPYVDVY